MKRDQRSDSTALVHAQGAPAEFGETMLAQQRDPSIRPLPNSGDRDTQQLGNDLHRSKKFNSLGAGHLSASHGDTDVKSEPNLSGLPPSKQATYPSELVQSRTMNLTSRLRILLNERGVPPSAHTRALADAAGISIQAVRLWFSHTTENIRNEHLISVAREFKTTIDWLLTGRGPMNDPYTTAFRVESNACNSTNKGNKRSSLIQINAFEDSSFIRRKDRGLRDVEVVEGITVSDKWLNHYCVTYTSIDNLAILNSDDDSMSESFQVGATLLIDRGVNELTTDGVYLFMLEQDTFIKRLQRLPGGAVRVISDNPRYGHFEISSKQREGLTLLARVLLAWNARQM